MSEYQHEDEKEYLIAESSCWRIWNNGIAETFWREKWTEENSRQSWEDRLKFIKLWETAEIAQNYGFDWNPPQIIPRRDGAITFLGFREQCPECKQSYMVWEGKIQLCKGCDYIHAFIVDDDN